MPTTQEILDNLQAIVNDYRLFALIWHAVIYMIIFALFTKRLPSNKLFTLILCFPILSVALFAFLSGNPFNGILFSILAILILIFGLKATGQAISLSQLPFIATGIIMIVFGLVYPHFVETNSIITYLYESPVGLIPCPTLSMLIGFVILFNGFGSLPVTISFTVYGLFYGIFGVVKLGVVPDLFLIFGSILLMVKYFLMLKTK